MQYTPTNWKDHIVDVQTGEIIQQGTPVDAERLNKIEQGILDAGNFAQEQLSPQIRLLQINWLELLMQRELEELSTPMDAGYWWDLLFNTTKLDMPNTTAEINTGEGDLGLPGVELAASAYWIPHEIGFISDKVCMYLDRTPSVITSASSAAAAGDTIVNIQAAEITVSES